MRLKTFLGALDFLLIADKSWTFSFLPQLRQKTVPNWFGHPQFSQRISITSHSCLKHFQSDFTGDAEVLSDFAADDSAFLSEVVLVEVDISVSFLADLL
jgi:hypothetical protein